MYNAQFNAVILLATIVLVIFYGGSASGTGPEPEFTEKFCSDVRTNYGSIAVYKPPAIQGLIDLCSKAELPEVWNFLKTKLDYKGWFEPKEICRFFEHELKSIAVHQPRNSFDGDLISGVSKKELQETLGKANHVCRNRVWVNPKKAELLGLFLRTMAISYSASNYGI